MRAGKGKSKSELIAPENYPPLLAKALRARAVAQLRSRETLALANRVIAMRAEELRGAVLELVGQLEQAAKKKDRDAIYATAHEIRGLADTAGLNATGRIANVFCHYLDEIARLGLEPDRVVTKLHLDAVVSSARTEDDAARHGNAVAGELAALVARQLAEVKVSARG